ncbi:MAG TPA: YHS domain-containing protein [Bacteroidota bacterium]|jgi:Cu+-exporting ATPase
MTRDVVCGMQIGPATAAGKSIYRGQTFFFCAPGCKKAFDKGPEPFVRKNESMKQHRTTAQPRESGSRRHP